MRAAASALACIPLVGLPVAAAAFYITAPTYTAHCTSHEPFVARDSAVLRAVGQSEGAPRNPGVRAFPQLLSVAEGRELLRELQVGW